MKNLFIVSLCAFFLTSIVSCSSSNNEEDNSTPPQVNKTTFIIEDGKEDLLYTIDNSYFKLFGITLYDKVNSKEICALKLDEQITDLKNGDTLIGKLEYTAEGDVSKIEIFNWCTITKIQSDKYEKVYSIKPATQNSLNLTLFHKVCK